MGVSAGLQEMSRTFLDTPVLSNVLKQWFDRSLPARCMTYASRLVVHRQEDKGLSVGLGYQLSMGRINFRAAGRKGTDPAKFPIITL